MNRRVDQKLHLAKLTLAAIDSALSSEKNPTIEIALVESALFHLHIAYRAYIHELLSHCKVSNSKRESIIEIGSPVIETAQQAAAVLDAQQIRSSDIDELVKMERSGAWPAQLHAAYIRASSHEETVVEPAPSSGIAVRDITAHIDGEVLAKWLQQFQILLNRQREHAHEW